MDRGHTLVLLPIFKDVTAIEAPPVQTKLCENGIVRQECAISGEVVEGGSGIPVIDEKPDCVCNDQEPYATSQEMGDNDFRVLGHTPRSIWAD